MLKECHRRVEDQCDTLLRLVPHVAAHGSDAAAAEAAAAVVRQPWFANASATCAQVRGLSGQPCNKTMVRGALAFHSSKAIRNRGVSIVFM
jgi:hypothetical protein